MLVCMHAYVGGCVCVYMCLMCDLAFIFHAFTYDLRNEDDVDYFCCGSPHLAMSSDSNQNKYFENVTFDEVVMQTRIFENIY